VRPVVSGCGDNAHLLRGERLWWTTVPQQHRADAFQRIPQIGLGYRRKPRHSASKVPETSVRRRPDPLAQAWRNAGLAVVLSTWGMEERGKHAALHKGRAACLSPAIGLGHALLPDAATVPKCDALLLSRRGGIDGHEGRLLTNCIAQTVQCRRQFVEWAGDSLRNRFIVPSLARSRRCR